ncbi:hypothetical protein CVT26_015494 [Gymnopilus dilepis]|uniref:Uncharacterized protein n=1 Tax=Gymnopilus dilepis TaxID=231916 RepID=A0A409WXH1_9AGAR|nr:hypothetical protein CVT26_015494 [Gymnopilus dilepis]
MSSATLYRCSPGFEPDDGYISSPSPIIFNVPLPPVPEEGSPAEVTTPPQAIAQGRADVPHQPVATTARRQPMATASSPAAAQGQTAVHLQPVATTSRVVGGLGVASSTQRLPSSSGLKVTYEPLPRASSSTAIDSASRGVSPLLNLPLDANLRPRPQGPPPASATQSGSHHAAQSVQLPRMRIIRVYIPPKPCELPQIMDENSWFYILTGGGGAGIFDSLETIERLCKHAGWNIHQIRRGWTAAYNAYVEAWETGTIWIEPDPNGAFANCPYVDIQVEESNQPLPDDKPPSSALVPPIKSKDYFYLIMNGEQAGIVGSWHDAAIRIKRVGGYVKKYAYYNNALLGYREKLNEMKITPRRYGLFDPAVANRLRAVIKAGVDVEA